MWLRTLRSTQSGALVQRADADLAGPPDGVGAGADADAHGLDQVTPSAQGRRWRERTA
jgi:hypothetical protein